MSKLNRRVFVSDQNCIELIATTKVRNYQNLEWLIDNCITSSIDTLGAIYIHRIQSFCRDNSGIDKSHAKSWLFSFML